MVQLIAHGDAICTPSVRAQTPRCHPVITNAEERRAVLQGMLEACSSGGTAFPFFSWNARSEVSTTTPEVALEAGKVACKTGTAEFGAADAQGNRRTHGWFVAVAQTPPARESEQIAQADTSTAGAVVKVQATKAAELSGLTEDALWRAWRQHTAQRQDAFPDRIVIVSLVESTVAQPFREGSRDAAPIAKALLDWMQTGKTKAPSAPAPSTTPAPKPEGE
jgi:cell division protein FtsI/penicillin-binding protein 2